MNTKNILGYVLGVFLSILLLYFVSSDLGTSFANAVNSLSITSAKSNTNSAKIKVKTDELSKLIREYESDIVITCEGGSNAKYKSEINKAKAMLDGSKMTQKEVESMCTSLAHSRDVALEETANQFALPEIQGEWHGVRREKHEVHYEEIYNAPNSTSGYDEEIYKTDIGSYAYAGDLDVQGTTIINNGPEYHWFGKEQDTVYGARHEIDACFLRRGTDVVDEKLFYSDSEQHEFKVSSKYDVYGYRTTITPSDQIAEKTYPLSQSMWYLMRSGDGDRLVWMRVFKDTRNHDSSYQKTDYKRQYYTVVKYIWTR
ncbi:MAG: hypothetical protein IKF78_03825 [Atopobiaceae bacterium]|nr:hypothetical protein [Atopobiaceae bacterium]